MSSIDNIINKIGKNPTIRDFGLYSSYEPNTTHKNIVYYATDRRKIYLNDKEYGSGTLDESVLEQFYTKEEVDNQLTELATDTYEAILTATQDKVDKIDGKQLSTEDFTTELKNKLNSLVNYDDTDVKEQIDELVERLNTLIGSGDVSEVIDTFNEIEDFLTGITNTETLTSLLQEMKDQILDSCSDTYLPLSGGTIKGNENSPFNISTTKEKIWMNLNTEDTKRVSLGWDNVRGSYIYDYANDKYLGIRPNGTLYCDTYTILHSGLGTSSQFLKADGSVDSTSYLPLTGGTVSGEVTIKNINEILSLYRNSDNSVPHT